MGMSPHHPRRTPGTRAFRLLVTLTGLTGLASAGACAAEGDVDGDAETLRAVDDVATVPINERLTIDVLANDTGLAYQPVVVTLLDSPERGGATVDADGAVVYQPDEMYAGADRVRYQLTDAIGATAEAEVAIDVACGSCADGVPITLSWSANDPTEMVLGYRLYLAPTEDPDTMEQVDEIVVTDAGFDPAAPGRVYDAWNDLRLELGDNACFRLTAYNEAGESDFSNAACKRIDGGRAEVSL
jgi:hypothetical protein